MKKLTFIIVCIAAMAIAGCKGEGTKNSVVGKWKVAEAEIKMNGGEEMIAQMKTILMKTTYVLNADSTYANETGSEMFNSSGTWKYNAEKNIIEFEQTGEGVVKKIWQIKSLDDNKMKVLIEKEGQISITLKLEKVAIEEKEEKSKEGQLQQSGARGG